MTTEVMFDILLRSAGSGRLPDRENVHDFYADAENVEKCRQWFAEHNIVLHATPFGLSGSTTREQFETVFAAKLEPYDTGPELTNYRIVIEPRPPVELAEMIDQITITTSPELF